MTYPKADQRRKTLRKEALERQKKWDELSSQQQLLELDKRPGESKKQRAKIQKKL